MDPDQMTYQGETYYGLPAVKHSHYSWPIVSYFFIGGLASAAQFIATVVDLFGRKEDRQLVSTGRYIALAGALMSPPLLIVDLHTPQRWFNMLRIFRRTSAMSIGTWSLTAFGLLSGFTAIGQIIEDLLGWKVGRWISRISSFPAAVTGGVVAIYTGTLLAATSTPLWASAFPYLSSLFASSAASTATAALILIAGVKGLKEETRRRLEWFSLVTGTVELLFAGLVDYHWRKEKVDSPLRKPHIGISWYGGVFGLAIIGPLILHLYQLFRPRVSRRTSILAAAGMLLGGFILRAVFVFGGNESSKRPQDYFRHTMP